MDSEEKGALATARVVSLCPCSGFYSPKNTPVARFRMKEILLDLADMTQEARPEIADQLVDFGGAPRPMCANIFR